MLETMQPATLELSGFHSQDEVLRLRNEVGRHGAFDASAVLLWHSLQQCLHRLALQLVTVERHNLISSELERTAEVATQEAP